MEELAKPAARALGWGSVALGTIGLLLPKPLGKLLQIDTTKKAGVNIARVLALRDLIVGIIILRAESIGALRLAVTIRAAFETSDTITFLVGRGVIKQPGGRLIALTIPPLIAFEVWVRNNLKEKAEG